MAPLRSKNRLGRRRFTIIGIGGYALYKLGKAIAKKLNSSNAEQDIIEMEQPV
jgi:hypothetical protein